jgi:hypothetical protein
MLCIYITVTLDIASYKVYRLLLSIFDSKMLLAFSFLKGYTLNIIIKFQSHLENVFVEKIFTHW